jgi:hypothetical protein
MIVSEKQSSRGPFRRYTVKLTGNYNGFSGMEKQSIRGPFSGNSVKIK